jgi:M6 family metalloprotease-like protein
MAIIIDPMPHPWRKLKDARNLAYESGMESIQNRLPNRGDQKLLVILADFSDRSGRFSGQAWGEFFFGQHGFSDYYREVSQQQLRYVGDVVGMHGNTAVKNDERVAYVRLPHSVSHYANGEAGRGATFPRNASGVVHDVLHMLDRMEFDFTPYANLETGIVDNVIIVFAGQNVRDTGDFSNSLMPTAYSLQQPYVTRGNQKILDFTFCPEQRRTGAIATIGVAVHEHGHALGMFDLYDLSENIVGVGRYDVMGYGIEPDTEDFQHPTHFGAFSKEFLGWIRFPANPRPFGSHDCHLAPAETGQVGQFIKLYPHGRADSDEYFLLENRQPLGFDSDWARLGLCPGLIIWHIDRRLALNQDTIINNKVNTPHSPPEHCGVMVVEANGHNHMVHGKESYGQASDTWTVGKTWGDTASPSLLWDGNQSGLSVTIQQQNEDGSLDLRIQGWMQQSI